MIADHDHTSNFGERLSRVQPPILQCDELNPGHPMFFVAPFSKYLVAFSLIENGNKLFAVSPSFVIGPK